MTDTKEFIFKVFVPEDEDEMDILTQISLIYYELFSSLLKLPSQQYEKLRVPLGLFLFGKPLPLRRKLMEKLGNWLKRTNGQVPPPFFYIRPSYAHELVTKIDEGEWTMRNRVSWRRFEERIGKSLSLKRRRGSGSVNNTLDLTSDYWEVELKVVTGNSIHRKFKLSFQRLLELFFRGFVRNRVPVLLVGYTENLNDRPKEFVTFLPYDHVINTDVFDVIGIDRTKLEKIERKGISVQFGEDGTVENLSLPVIFSLPKGLNLLVSLLSVPILREMFSVNPLGDPKGSRTQRSGENNSLPSDTEDRNHQGNFEPTQGEGSEASE